MRLHSTLVAILVAAAGLGQFAPPISTGDRVS
jgi:hypothetical protein